MKNALALTLAAAALFLTAGPTLAAPDTAVAGQKLDSGLGELPNYSQWTDPTGRHPMGERVLGESLDSGLGELPHYSKWLDRSGRDPMHHAVVQVATRQR